MSMSRGDMSSRRMFSTSPSGVTPGVEQDPGRTAGLLDRHEAGEAVLGAQQVGRLAVLEEARRDAGIGGERVGGRFAGPWSRSRRSVMLSTSVVIVSESTGTSGIVSIVSPVTTARPARQPETRCPAQKPCVPFPCGLGRRVNRRVAGAELRRSYHTVRGSSEWSVLVTRGSWDRGVGARRARSRRARSSRARGTSRRSRRRAPRPPTAWRRA